MYYVYRITNVINNKVYIGRTGNLKRRFKDHIDTALYGNSDQKQYIHRAMAKYGVENFKFDILSKHYKFKVSCKEEIKQIRLYKSIDNKYGYNLSLDFSEYGESSNRKLTQDQVIEIFKYYLSSKLVSVRDVVKKFKICKDSVFKILDRKTYLEVKINKTLVDKVKNKRNTKYIIPLEKRQLTSKLSYNQVFDLLNKFSTGKYTHQMLADEFELKSLGTITFILNRETWKNVKINKKTLEKINYYKDHNKFHYDEINKKLILKSEIIEKAMNLMLNDLLLTDAAKSLNISPTTLCDILNERTCKNIEINNELLIKFRNKFPEYLKSRIILC